jgi:16S rRNA (guanine1207-N2)-methyltransferase
VAAVPDPSSDVPRVGDDGHYFSARPGVGSRPSEVRLDLPERTLVLRTDRGVFSADRVDPGTKLLLLELPGPDAWPEGAVLDLGCGYGPIATTVALRDRDREVWAIDVNERARELCAANAGAAGVGDTVHVATPEGVPGGRRFGLVVSNPPIRIGKAALHDLLATWLGRLTADGEAWLVVQKHLGSDSLADWVQDRGWTVERVRSRQGYRVLRLSDPPADR